MPADDWTKQTPKAAAVKGAASQALWILPLDWLLESVAAKARKCEKDFDLQCTKAGSSKSSAATAPAPATAPAAKHGNGKGKGKGRGKRAATESEGEEDEEDAGEYASLVARWRD